MRLNKSSAKIFIITAQICSQTIKFSSLSARFFAFFIFIFLH